MKKDEHARKRKELTKRKIQEEKNAALNRLVSALILTGWHGITDPDHSSNHKRRKLEVQLPSPRLSLRSLKKLVRLLNTRKTLSSEPIRCTRDGSARVTGASGWECRKSGLENELAACSDLLCRRVMELWYRSLIDRLALRYRMHNPHFRSCRSQSYCVRESS